MNGKKQWNERKRINNAIVQSRSFLKSAALFRYTGCRLNGRCLFIFFRWLRFAFVFLCRGTQIHWINAIDSEYSLLLFCYSVFVSSPVFLYVVIHFLVRRRARRSSSHVEIYHESPFHLHSWIDTGHNKIK